MKNPINKIVIIGVMVISCFLLNGCNKKQSLEAPMTYSELIQSIEDTTSYILTGDIVLKYDDENNKTINFTSEVKNNNFNLKNVKIFNGTESKNLLNLISKDDENIYINMDIDNLKGYVQLPYINVEQPSSNEYNILKNEILTTLQEHIKGYEKQEYISYFEYNINKNDEEFTNLINDMLDIMQEYKPELKKVMVEQLQYGKELIIQYIDLYSPYLKTVSKFDDKAINEYKTKINDDLANIIEKLPYEIDQNINGMTILDNLNIAENIELSYSIGMKDNGDITLGIIIEKEPGTYYTPAPSEIKLNVTLTPTEFAEDLSFTPTTNANISVDKALNILLPMILGAEG